MPRFGGALPMLDELKLHPGFTSLFVYEPNMRNKQRGKGRLKLTHSGLKEVCSITRHIDESLHSGESYASANVSIQLLYLLTLLSDAYVQAPKKEHQTVLRVGKVIEHLDEHFRENFDGDELAKLMHVSPATFYRLFKEATGTTPTQYVNNLRIEEACNRLRQTDETITNIAFDVGIQDSNYFSRTFKKCTGMTPRAYRESVLAGA